MCTAHSCMAISFGSFGEAWFGTVPTCPVPLQGGSQVFVAAASHLSGGALVTASRSGAMYGADATVGDVPAMMGIQMSIDVYIMINLTHKTGDRSQLWHMICQKKEMPAVWNRLGPIQLNHVEAIPNLHPCPDLRSSTISMGNGVPGIVEWVQETETLGEILVGSSNTDGAHQRGDGMQKKCHGSPVLVCWWTPKCSKHSHGVRKRYTCINSINITF